jgi:hypothetical protein
LVVFVIIFLPSLLIDKNLLSWELILGQSILYVKEIVSREWCLFPIEMLYKLRK